MAGKNTFQFDLNSSNVSEATSGSKWMGEEMVDDVSENGHEDVNPLNEQAKRKRYYRHTPRQVQEMEVYFKDCPNPDDKQRKELSLEIGLEPYQIKFWFQNKRTQVKTHNDRLENTQLRAENEKLSAENLTFKETLGNASCPKCGGRLTFKEMCTDERQLIKENLQLRKEIDRISSVAAKYMGKPFKNRKSSPKNPPLASP